MIQAEELKRLLRKTVTIHNAHANADETYVGVELADLLAKYGAPLGKELRGAALANYVVATGSDGYTVVFSLAEVDPSFHPGDVLVADTMDGKPLDARSGPLRLLVTEDKRPARGVRNLVGVGSESGAVRAVKLGHPARRREAGGADGEFNAGYLTPITIDSGPIKCSVRASRNPTSFIQPMQSSPV